MIKMQLFRELFLKKKLGNKQQGLENKQETVREESLERRKIRGKVRTKVIKGEKYKLSLFKKLQ